MTTEALQMLPPSPVDGYQDEERPEVAGPWRIESVEQADWALFRLGELERQMQENTLAAEVRIAELRARLAYINAQAQRGADFFRWKLQQYALEAREELLGGGKKKTRDLPSGSISFRSKGGGLQVVDRDALLAWAVEQPVELGLYRVKQEPALDEVKRHFKKTGELPPGTDLEPEREEVVVKPAAAAPKGA